MTMPAVPGSGFIVVQPEFVFGGLEAVLDRPAMTLDLDKNIYGRTHGTPSGEEGQISVGDVAPDQKAPRPSPACAVIETFSVKVRQLYVGPAMQSCALGPLASGEPLPI